jgi:hypothetical protein
MIQASPTLLPSNMVWCVHSPCIVKLLMNIFYNSWSPTSYNYICELSIMYKVSIKQPYFLHFSYEDMGLFTKMTAHQLKISDIISCIKSKKSWHISANFLLWIIFPLPSRNTVNLTARALEHSLTVTYLHKTHTIVMTWSLLPTFFVFPQVSLQVYLVSI